MPAQMCRSRSPFDASLAHDDGMTVLHFSDEARAIIDPVVVAHGFASGQGDGSQVIFCASLDELADRFRACHRWASRSGVSEPASTSS